MNPLCKTFVVGTALLLGGQSLVATPATATIPAQATVRTLPSTADPLPPQAIALPGLPQLLSQVSNPPDLALLAKLITGFFKGNDYQTASSLDVNAVIGTTTVTSKAQIQTIAQFPNKFRTEISFAKPGEPTQVKTLVVSNGTRVWVYRADLKQYAVFPYAKFDALDDSYWIGFSTMMFAQIPLDVKQLVAQGVLSDAEVLKKIGLELGDLSGSSQTIDKQNFYAYEYNDVKEGYRFGALVEPKSAVLKQLRIVGKYEGSDITMIEQIRSRVSTPPASASTFTFAPPKGAKKVTTLAIGPL